MSEREPLPSLRPAVPGRTYIVASGHHPASTAAARVLEMGGNVVDAGIAAGLRINVVQPGMTNHGGVAPIILRTAHSGVVVTSSRGRIWPASRSRRAEGRIAPDVRAELAPMRHRLETWPDWMPQAGAVCAAGPDQATGTLAGGADPRRVAYAVGW